MATNNQAHVNIAKINSKDMYAHPVAQREFDKKHADNIAKHFSWDKFKPIDVSFRDGKYWVIDGQHRLYAIKKINYGKDCAVLCNVHYGMTLIDEANFFLDQQCGVKKIKINDNLKVLYKIGDESVTSMVRGAVAAGWTVDFSTEKKDGRIIAVATLKRIFNALPYEQYVSVLKTIKNIWDGNADSICREMMLGMSYFFKTYYGQFSPTDLESSLRRVSPLAILRDGRVLGSSKANNSNKLAVGRPFAKCILREYNNKRRKNKLEDVL